MLQREVSQPMVPWPRGQLVHLCLSKCLAWPPPSPEGEHSREGFLGTWCSCGPEKDWPGSFKQLSVCQPAKLEGGGGWAQVPTGGIEGEVLGSKRGKPGFRLGS